MSPQLTGERDRLVAEFLRTGCELVLEAKRQVGRDLLGVRAEKRQLTNRVPVVSRDDDVGNSVVGALQKILEIAYYAGSFGRFSANKPLRLLEVMDEGKIGHDHAKCFGVSDSSEDLCSDSIQFVENFVRQRSDDSGVDSLKWNVPPLIFVKILKFCLSGLGFETHDDVLGEGVPSPDLKYGKESFEIALGEPGIDCEPDLKPLRFGGDDSVLQRIFNCILSGHANDSLCCSVKQICMKCKSSNRRTQLHGG